ncbi:hypothetical protein HN51_029676 [Arachis hypogaea]
MMGEVVRWSGNAAANCEMEVAAVVGGVAANARKRGYGGCLCCCKLRSGKGLQWSGDTTTNREVRWGCAFGGGYDARGGSRDSGRRSAALHFAAVEATAPFSLWHGRRRKRELEEGEG